MKKGTHEYLKILEVIVVLILLSGMSQSSDWPMFAHDLGHTGQTAEIIPDELELIWSYETGDSIYSVVVANGKVFFASDGTLFVLDETTGKLIWSYRLGDHVSSPCVSDGKVFIGSSDGKIYCLNENTGEIIWKYDADSWLVPSPAVADSKVFLGSIARLGVIYSLNENDGKIIWRNLMFGATPGVAALPPAVADGKVFVGFAGIIYCLDEDTGESIWTYGTGYLSSPVVSNGKVFVGGHKSVYIESDAHDLCALNETTGELIWSNDAIGTVDSSPAVAYGKVFAGFSNRTPFVGEYETARKICALNEPTGELIWCHDIGSTVDSSPAVSDGKVFIGSGDNKIYSLNETTGELIWSYKTGGEISSSPVVADGKLFIGSSDGKLYCFAKPFLHAELEEPKINRSLSVIPHDVMLYAAILLIIAVAVLSLFLYKLGLTQRLTENPGLFPWAGALISALFGLLVFTMAKTLYPETIMNTNFTEFYILAGGLLGLLIGKYVDKQRTGKSSSNPNPSRGKNRSLLSRLKKHKWTYINLIVGVITSGIIGGSLLYAILFCHDCSGEWCSCPYIPLKHSLPPGFEILNGLKTPSVTAGVPLIFFAIVGLLLKAPLRGIFSTFALSAAMPPLLVKSCLYIGEASTKNFFESPVIPLVLFALVGYGGGKLISLHHIKKRAYQEKIEEFQERVRQWKSEGYNVSELEEMLK